MKFPDELFEQSAAATNYVKLKDKEALECIFVGAMAVHYVVWNEGRSAAAQKGTPGAKPRFKINALVKDGTSYVAKVFEMNKTTGQQIADLAKEYTLEETVVKISRNGTGKDTVFSILPLPKKLSKETVEYLKTIKLNKLDSSNNEGDEAFSFDSSEEIPF